MHKLTIGCHQKLETFLAVRTYALFHKWDRSGRFAVQRFYHVSSAPSTPQQLSARHPQPPPSSLHGGEFRDPKKVTMPISVSYDR